MAAPSARGLVLAPRRRHRASAMNESFVALAPEDVRACVLRIPASVQSASYRQRRRLVIAGGFIRSFDFTVARAAKGRSATLDEVGSAFRRREEPMSLIGQEPRRFSTERSP